MSIFRWATSEQQIFDRESAWNPGGGSGRMTVSGEFVTPDVALTLSTCFACVRNIGDDTAKLALNAEEFDGTAWRKAPDAPFAGVAGGGRMNPEMVDFAVRSFLVAQCAGWKGGYAEIEWSSRGEPVALWPIHSSRSELMREPGGERRLFLRVWIDDISQSLPGRLRGAGAVDIAYQNVFHLPSPLWDGGRPIGTIQRAAESIGAALAAQKHAAAYFGAGAKPGLIVQHAGSLGEDEKKNLRESFDQFKGAKSFGLMLLEYGLDLKEAGYGIDPEKLQLVETRKYSSKDVCKWWRMPPSKVQDLEDAHYANREQDEIAYYTDCIMRYTELWEQETRRKLIPEAERSLFRVQHDFSSTLRADSQARAAYGRTMVSAGGWTPNEFRASEGFAPLKTPGMDEPWMQGAMAPVRRLAEAPSPAPAIPVRDDTREQSAERLVRVDSMRPVIADCAQRIAARETVSARKMTAKNRATTQAHMTWRVATYRALATFAFQCVRPVVEACGSGGDIEAWAESYAGNRANATMNVPAERLVATLEADEFMRARVIEDSLVALARGEEE